ncbi:tripartite tricarboxylate transporter substrate-binding protein [Variovorax sp. KK3]|uniref:tripartite tricarboxylate transporter substrate-binding protein n=1 Tax=Variovorax sp. KK3 TaxID=1855728 RepID=UPI00097BBC56|nr:tripartite tricarboxylate transporter substrate-binding protein [Variovorax sp. KK3]
MTIRFLCAFLVALCASASPAHSQEREFPTRAIRLVLPFAPGAAADAVARILAEQMSQRLQQPVVVDNRAGAGGALGAEAIAAAAPDGYTIGIAAVSTHVVGPGCNPNLRYDPIKSFTPIAMVADMPTILAARPGLAADFAAFRELARQRAEPRHYGIPGNCTLGHLVLEHLNHELDGTMVAVPYRGSAATAADLAAGRVDFMSDSPALLLPYIEAGRMKALAVAWPTRLPALPDVPTYHQLGLPALDITIWYGIVGPAGLPPAVVAKYETVIAQCMADADLQARFDKAGVTAVHGASSTVFGAFLRERYARESQFIRSRGMSSN